MNPQQLNSLSVCMALARAFLYGFLFFFLSQSVMNLPYLLGEVERPFFAYRYMTVVSLIGAMLAAISRAAFMLLARLVRGLWYV
jgi:hypothetical protein